MQGAPLDDALEAPAPLDAAEDALLAADVEPDDVATALEDSALEAALDVDALTVAVIPPHPASAL